MENSLSSNENEDLTKNQHNWEYFESFASLPHPCIVCLEYIWGLNTKCYQCTNCKVWLHKSCIMNLDTTLSCGKVVPTPSCVHVRVRNHMKDKTKAFEKLEKSRDEESSPPSIIQSKDDLGEILELFRNNLPLLYNKARKQDGKLGPDESNINFILHLISSTQIVINNPAIQKVLNEAEEVLVNPEIIFFDEEETKEFSLTLQEMENALKPITTYELNLTLLAPLLMQSSPEFKMNSSVRQEHLPLNLSASQPILARTGSRSKLNTRGSFILDRTTTYSRLQSNHANLVVPLDVTTRKKALTCAEGELPQLNDPSSVETETQLLNGTFINIEVQLEKEEYLPGEMIVGSMYVDLIKPLQNIVGVKLLIQGIEQACEKEKPGQSEIKFQYQTKFFFTHQIVLWQPSKAQSTLNPGQHNWNFSFRLPSNLPPTLFLDPWISNFYQIRGFIAIQKPNEELTEVPISSRRVFIDVFGVCHNMWREVIMKLAKPISANYLISSHQINLSATVARKDWSIGQPIEVNIEINNLSDKAVVTEGFTINLIQQLCIQLPTIHRLFEEKVVASKSIETHGYQLEPLSKFEKIFHLALDDFQDYLVPSVSNNLFIIFHNLEIKLNNLPGIRIPVRIWDHLWPEKRKDTGLRKPSANQVPSDWRFQTVRVWSKPIKELPVAIDLPRLAAVMTIDNTVDPSLCLKQSEYFEALFDYSSTNTVMSTGDVDLSFHKNDLLKFLENRPNGWLKVEFNDQTGVVPGSFVKKIVSTETKEEKVKNIMVTLCKSVDSIEKAKKIEENFWKFIPKVTTENRDISRELNRFLIEILKDDSVTGRILKACNQSIIAPAVIELTLNVSSMLSFKDGGGWRIQIIVSEENIKVIHFKRQHHVPKAPEVQQFSFEWKLILTFDKKAESIVDFSFKLSQLDFTDPNISEGRKSEIRQILEDYFQYGPTKKKDAIPQSIFPKKERLHAPVIKVDSDEGDTKVCQFFGLGPARELRDLDLIYQDNAQNLSMYRDEEDQVLESISPERRARITLLDKIRRKWMKPLNVLLPTIVPHLYQKIEISTPEGFLQRNPKLPDVSISRRMRSFLETVSILLGDTKETLPSLIKHFPVDNDITSEALRDFISKHIHPDCKTIRLLKAMHIGLVSSAFGIIKEHFNDHHFPIVDIGSAWKVHLFIGRGDRKSHDKVIVTHSKGSKSLEVVPEGRFELLWELKIFFDFDLKELKRVELKIPLMQFGPRFSSAKKKLLLKLQQNFNEEMDLSSIYKRLSNPRERFVLRREKRLQLKNFPQNYLANPTLTTDCTLNVEIMEARKLRNVVVLSQKKTIRGKNLEKEPLNAYCTITLENQSFRTKTLYGTNSPRWYFEQEFQVKNPDTEILSISLSDERLPHAMEFGFVKIPIKTLKDQEKREEWFPLHPTIQEELTEKPGEILIKIKYTEQILLPGPLFNEFFNLISSNNFELIRCLGRVLLDDDDRNNFGKCLVRLYEASQSTPELIKTLLATEISHTQEAHILFRGSSLATKTLDLYMRQIGKTYLKETLSAIVSHICHAKKGCELDPQIKKKASIEKSAKRLTEYVNTVTDAIFKSVNQCPGQLRQIFHHIRALSSGHFSKDSSHEVHLTSISGFIFMRFFCPALMEPKDWGITDFYPDPVASKTLTLVVKTVQKIANLSAFDQGDYMDRMNELIHNKIEPMKVFLTEIANYDPKDSKPQKVSIGPTKRDRELGNVCRYFRKYQDKLQKNQTPEEAKLIRRLIATLENIEALSQPDLPGRKF